jgi:DNA-binding NarL/FixJ family response regulator
MAQSLQFGSDLDRENAGSSPPSRQDGAGKTVGVYVVDSHPAIREVLAGRIREEGGMRVVGEHGQADRALAGIAETVPDVAVLDISLDGADGLTLTRRITSRAPATRVLIFSVYEGQIFAERALQAGAAGFLHKGASPQEVLRAIRRVHKGEVYLPNDVQARLLKKVVGSPGEATSGFDALTDREWTVFQRIGEGDSVAEIADSLHLSRKTIETYRRRAKEKLGCDTLDDLLRYAVLWTTDRM